MSTDQFFIQKRAEFFIRKLEDLRDLVRGTEAIKEMQERHAGLEGRHLSDRGKIMRLLYAAGREQCPAGLADSHHVLVIAVNRKRMSGNRAGCNMEDGAGEFTSDLVHVRDHQEEPLGGSEGCGQCPGLEGTVYGTCCAAFGLHLHDERGST